MHCHGQPGFTAYCTVSPGAKVSDVQFGRHVDLCHVFVMKVQLFPLFPFNSFVNCMAESLPIFVLQRRSPFVFLNAINIGACFQRVDFFSSQCHIRSFGLWTLKSHTPLRKRPTSNALWLSMSMKLLNPSMMPLLLLSCPLLCSESGCHHPSADSHKPCGAACALNTFASLASVSSCTTSTLLGALHSCLPPHTAHHQLQCFFFLLLPSACLVDTHQIQSSKAKLLQCGQIYDKLTPPIPPTGATTLCRKSVLFLNFSRTMPKRQISSFATFS